MSKILLIEDDLSTQKRVTGDLEGEGYTVKVAVDGKIGLEMLRREQPDLVLLDLMQPEMDGYEVCRSIRADKATLNVPVIILSDSNDVADKVIGLELGADDYISKPFNSQEFLARIKARLREGQRNYYEQKPWSLTWEGLEIWPDSYLAAVNGEKVTLTIKECRLLQTFMLRPRYTYTREYLQQKVWGHSRSSDARTLDVHISNLRTKLKGLGPVIESVRGVGYRFVANRSEKRNDE